MKKYMVRITKSGMIFLPKSGRKVRTPSSLILNEKELQQVRIILKQKGLKYIIEEINEDGENLLEKPTISKKVIIEELTSIDKKEHAEPESFLDKLISEEEK